jgi:hypothetical protein
MDPEVVAVEPAPEQVTTAVTPEPVVETPGEQVEAPKTFTQEELDAAISKRLAREQRKWDRERQMVAQVPQAPAVVPPIDQFESPEAYAEVLAQRKAEELVAKREQQRQQTEVIEAYHDREEEVRAKYTDFDQVAYNPNLRITTEMAQTIQSSDIGPELAYHLGTNPKEAERISRLTPLAQAREIGRLEAKLVAEPVTKKVSSAPAPIAPVVPRSIGTPTYDTTDPRSIKTMSTSEWIAADRARQRKLLEARNR